MSQSADPFRLQHLDHFVLTVADIHKTISFYETTLGMQPQTFTTADGSARHALLFGQSKINLHQKGQEFEPKSAHPTPGSADLCFLTQTPIADWISRLITQGVPIEEGPVSRTGATGPLISIYLRDPDQNLVEISTMQD